VAVATATPDSGGAPLVVQFSSAGSYDPDTNDVVSLVWSFFGDGATNSTTASPTFTYTNAGNYQAQLAVTDSDGNRTVANVSIAVGNHRPVVSIHQPPNGAIFDWGKAMAYQVSAFDFEDGSTTNGTIACSNTVTEPFLGHNDHAHGLGVLSGCSGVFTAPINTDSDSDNLFLVLNSSYTDVGALSVSPLIGTSTHVFQPRHKQAEFCTTNNGVTTGATSDSAGGGLDVTSIDHGDFVGLSPVNLTNINAITFRLASGGLGGRIETRVDSPAGSLLATADVPFTGGGYTNVTVPISDPGGTHTLYFVFVRNPGDANLFVLNWFEFQGPGLSLSSTPFGGIPRPLPGIVQAEDFDEGGEGVAYHDVDVANNGGQYRATGVDIETTSDSGGGFNLGWTRAGELLNYNVNVSTPGLYALTLRAASSAGGSSVHVEFDGVNKTGPIIIPNTGGWQTWQNITVSNVVLDAGLQMMRLVMDGNSTNGGDVGNLNYLQAFLTLSNNPPTVSLTAPAAFATYSTDTPITVSANASDAGGSVAKVDFLASANLIGTDTSAPYSMTWSNASAGSYDLTARATDNLGNTRTSLARTLNVVNGQASFTGFPQTVPGIIQVENFDDGGEGIAYHDNDTSNNGSQYRTTAVDIENCADSGGGYNVGWSSAGEWLEYTINAAVDGLYTLQIRTASSGHGGSFHVEIDGVNKTGSMTNSDSGGWQAWRNLTKPIGLTAGVHVMRLALDSNGTNGTVGNFNHFAFTTLATNSPSVLAHRYSFEGAPGSTYVADSVGTAHGTVIGGAAFTGDGKLNLLGTNGFVDLPNGIISSVSNVTIEAWITWNGGAQWQRVFDFGNNSAGENNQGTGQRYLALTPRSSVDVVRFAVTTNSAAGQTVLQGTAALPTGRQIHVAVCYNFLAGTTDLYLNGQLIAIGSAPIPLNSITDVNVWLGKSQWNDPYFNGQFEEFRIHNGALSGQSVAASFAAGPDALLGPLPNLAAARTGNSLTLSWSWAVPGFVLETSSPATGSATWTAVTNVVVLQNGQHIVTMPISNSAQFFRLRK
jgi:PKD repeat protein